MVKIIFCGGVFFEKMVGCARGGASGPLHPKSAYAGSTLLETGIVRGKCTPDAGAGPRAQSAREPRQARKGATVSGVVSGVAASLVNPSSRRACARGRGMRDAQPT